MSYREIAIVVLASIGVLFSLISSIGIVRLPDVFSRMHAAGKASTLGVITILLAAGIFFPSQIVMVVVIIFLFLLTAPIATTTMARASYRTNENVDEVLNYDDLAEFESATKP